MTTRDYERQAAESLVYLPKLIADEFQLSTSEGRRLLVTGGVKLDGSVLSYADSDIARDQLRGKTLTVGKRRSVEL